MWRSQSTPTQRIFVHFVRLSLCKNAKCDVCGLFVVQTFTIGEQKINPKWEFFKRIFTDSDYSRPNSFRLPRSASGSSITSKYAGIARSFATRRTLGIPKLLMCINKAQPERIHVIKKHISGAGAMLTKKESSGAAAVAISFLQELRSPGCDFVFHFWRNGPSPICFLTEWVMCRKRLKTPVLDLDLAKTQLPRFVP